ncbi:hypothetical protein ACFL5W_00635 [Thermodesulfobacteriota bacterium]
MNEIIITIDVDWASDPAIQAVSNILRYYKIKSTWFVTHNSEAIDSLKVENGLFELGIHPNFMPGSSHGESIQSVISSLLEIVPNAISMRSHAVYQSSPLLAEIVRETPIKIDSTLFLPEMPNIVPVRHLTPYGALVRLPFFWADDYELLKEKPLWNFNRFIDIPGIKVLMFHPIHIALNSNSMEIYNKYKTNNMRSCKSDSQTIMDSIMNSTTGVASFFMEAIKYLNSFGLANKHIKDFKST